MPHTLVPIVVIEGPSRPKLRHNLTSSRAVRVLDVLAPEKYQNIPTPELAVPDMLVVIDADSVEKEPAITMALLLRNAGHQVFIAAADDSEDLLKLLKDIYNHIVQIVDRRAPFRTEVMITEHALELLGDVTPIVERFEAKYLRGSDQKN